MLSNDEIKQVFFYCTHKDPQGLYADEVDILEFGNKIAAYVMAQRKPMTEDQVLDFMMNVKVGSNGDALLDRVKTLVREVESFHGIKKPPEGGNYFHGESR